MFESVSLQSSLFKTYPGIVVSQLVICVPLSPNPSPSKSKYHVCVMPPSSVPSQSLSSPSQTSGAPGKTDALRLSQSPATVTYPGNEDSQDVIASPELP